jgi:Fe-S-cluster-containing dehydrogenase component/anaerobic selenocysteine-containing dehydrogenase
VHDVSPIDSDKKIYWLAPHPTTESLAADTMRVQIAAPEASRRDFLKLTGFSLAGVVAACSRPPVQDAIPYLNQPTNMVPGRAYIQTSSCGACQAGCGVLVRTSEGRPVKLEGNPHHPLSLGGLCAVGQASTLALYDAHRLAEPLKNGAATDWTAADEAIVAGLAAAGDKGVRILTGAALGPTLLSAVNTFVAAFSSGKHVAWDSLHGSATLEAHGRTHGARVAPRVRLDRADVIASFEADFLGTWVSPVEFAAGYREGRRLEGEHKRFSHHTQVESRMSLTGSRADTRVRTTPDETGALLAGVATRLAVSAGASVPFSPVALSPMLSDEADRMAERLWAARGKAVVLCGIGDTDAQSVANFSNHLLGAYGTVLDLARPSRQIQGDDAAMAELLAEMANGTVGALIMIETNPVFQHVEGAAFAAALAKVPLVVSLAMRLDETASLSHWVCPDSHPLEAWGDTEPVSGIVTVQQPAIAPLGKTRPALESLAAWAGAPRSALDQVKERWEEELFPRMQSLGTFREFWDGALTTGVVEVPIEPLEVNPFDQAGVLFAQASALPEGQFAMIAHPTIQMLDGSHAYNAWLHELPDPISKVTWDNVAAVSVSAAATLNVRNGDLVRLDSADGRRATLPVFVQPGQHERTVAVGLGFGSVLSARFSDIGPKWINHRPSTGENGLVGTNVAPLIGRAVRVSKTGGTRPLASTQEHFRMDANETLGAAMDNLPTIIKETTVAALLGLHGADGGHGEAHAEGHGPGHADLWPEDHKYEGRKWGMSIDLTSCTGCSACVVACQVENNIPVVGRDEVQRSREMHWLRLDRYYSGNGDDVDLAQQPMLCQHCDNAPCETVCPVAATVHNDEGLNVQVYNRCIGTRFCANNCPYKVRRFNWFEPERESPMENLALSPDVTVRSRGVMEKCSFCMHRIQEAEIEAKSRGEAIPEGGLKTACQQSCPSTAIVFGDVNDPESKVSALRTDGRAYQALGELNVKPAVTYLSLVRNRERT